MAAALGFAFLLALMFGGVPIAFAMTLAGFVGFGFVVGWQPALHMMSQVVHDSTLSYTFSVLPLFILMGNFVARSRLAADLFVAADAWVGHRRGGLAEATIWACGGFAAVCGSSAATSATMVHVALPSMRKRGYADTLSLGTIAAGGTLGILIPPSGIMLLYGIATGTSVPALFAAGVIPGIIACLLLAGTVRILTWRNPALAPAGARATWPDRLATLWQVWGVIALFALIMGGILGGVFTATEGGGIGAFGALLFALHRRALDWKSFVGILIQTGVTSAMIFAILFGAFVFATFVEVSGAPKLLGGLVRNLSIDPTVVMLAIIVIYILLGVILEEISMMFLTLPLFFPLVTQLGYDPVWFGIILVIVIELGMITPPIGINLFVIKAMVPETTQGQMLEAILPFTYALVVLLVLLLAFPELVLYLPRLIL